MEGQVRGSVEGQEREGGWKGRRERVGGRAGERGWVEEQEREGGWKGRREGGWKGRRQREGRKGRG